MDLINRNYTHNFPELLNTLREMLSFENISAESGIAQRDLEALAEKKRVPESNEIWKILSICNKYGFFELLPEHGIPPVTFDLSSRFPLLEAPIGFDIDPPIVPLRKEQTNIAGYLVDFPLGLPASIIAANSKFIEFYARRGFDILTYKTVRSTPFRGHPFPNWVFIKDPAELKAGTDNFVVGPIGYWPEEFKKITMANSFGIPSLAPEWWKKDISRARGLLKEGHQVLIVSVVSSVEQGGKDEITDDFVKTAILAKEAGAQIIEANYSCPNAVGEPGDIYQYPERAAYISKALKEVLGKTPVFVKIGYLPKSEIHKFVEKNVNFIDGVVAINTVSAKINDAKGKETFGTERARAGVSGWAIKSMAQEVARNLVEARKQAGKNFTIMGLGGVMSKEDYDEFKAIGIDAVESCTGAFLNPNLGLEVRYDFEAAREKPSALAFGLDVAGKFLEAMITHPTKTARLRVDFENRRAIVE